MAKLILLRHGESMWNKKNLFTGWVDVPLSQKGIEEAQAAGSVIRHVPIDVIYCSKLIRATMTAMLAMAYHEEAKTPIIMHSDGKLKDWGSIASKEELAHIIPVFCSEELNERMYGDLQGLNKKETMDKYGEEQVKIWRRSYSICPPKGESLELTAKRVIPYFEKNIYPHLKQGKNILISAHGNSLRAIVKFLENVSDDAIVGLEIATGVPLVYSYENGSIMKDLSFAEKHKG